MDLFTKLFGDFLVFVYHCFDRIVIRGYRPRCGTPRARCRLSAWRCAIIEVGGKIEEIAHAGNTHAPKRRAAR